jgi:hypothetical protein
MEYHFVFLLNNGSFIVLIEKTSEIGEVDGTKIKDIDDHMIILPPVW